MGRAVGPIVPPANDHVTAVHGVAMVTKIPALIFEFDSNSLPFARSDLTLGLAVRVTCLYRFDGVAQFLGNHSEQKYDALFVYRLMP
jgi:hypothetical protein